MSIIKVCNQILEGWHQKSIAPHCLISQPTPFYWKILATPLVSWVLILSCNENASRYPAVPDNSILQLTIRPMFVTFDLAICIENNTLRSQSQFQKQVGCSALILQSGGNLGMTGKMRFPKAESWVTKYAAELLCACSRACLCCIARWCASPRSLGFDDNAPSLVRFWARDPVPGCVCNLISLFFFCRSSKIFLFCCSWPPDILPRRLHPQHP